MDDERFWLQKYTELLKTHADVVSMLYRQAKSENNAERNEMLKGVMQKFTDGIKAKTQAKADEQPAEEPTPESEPVQAVVISRNGSGSLECTVEE